MDAIGDRAKGALLGLAVGDALGAPVEFKARGSFEPVTAFRPTRHFNLAPGVWTDDTAMAVCLGEALVSAGGYDSYHIMDEFLAWWRKGKHTPEGYCFDCGIQTSQRLGAYEVEPVVSEKEPRTTTAGNGCIMRLAPVPIWTLKGSEETTARLAALSARETHYSHEAEEATAVFALLLRFLMKGHTPAEALSRAAEVDSRGLSAHLAAATEETVVGSGYVRDSLQAAWWAFSSSASFSEAVLKAVNLGDDADTTGAIAGQLAGAYFGASAIPQHWREQVWRGAQLEELAEALLATPVVLHRTRFRGEDSFGAPH